MFIGSFYVIEIQIIVDNFICAESILNLLVITRVSQRTMRSREVCKKANIHLVLVNKHLAFLIVRYLSRNNHLCTRFTIKTATLMLRKYKTTKTDIIDARVTI